MNLLTRIRSLWTTRPPDEESELSDRARSVAIIMDGNGRWARRRGLSVAEGHRAGTKALRRAVEAAIELDVESLAVYAFSTENWSRTRDEIDTLMEIFGETIDREFPDLVRQGVRVRFIGRRDRAPDELQRKMASLERQTTENTRLRLWIAFDYGGRAEIVEAARQARRVRCRAEEIDETSSPRTSMRPRCPTPTSSFVPRRAARLEFLLWQLAYTELVFVDSHWPDFTPRDLESALSAYARRRRRFGGR